GFMFNLSYVLSKSLDDSSGPSFDETTGLGFNDLAGFSLPYVWARSQYDRRQNFIAFYAYDLPAVRLRGALGLLLNRWRITGATEFRSGTPMDLLSFSINGRPDIVGPYRRFDPRHVRTFVINGTPVTGNFFFDPTAFRDPVGTSSSPSAGNL